MTVEVLTLRCLPFLVLGCVNLDGRVAEVGGTSAHGSYAPVRPPAAGSTCAFLRSQQHRSLLTYVKGRVKSRITPFSVLIIYLYPTVSLATYLNGLNQSCLRGLLDIEQ